MAEAQLQKLRRLPSNRECPNCGAQNRMGHSNVCMAFKTFVCSTCKSAHQSFSHRVKVMTHTQQFPSFPFLSSFLSFPSFFLSFFVVVVKLTLNNSTKIHKTNAYQSQYIQIFFFLSLPISPYSYLASPLIFLIYLSSLCFCVSSLWGE